MTIIDQPRLICVRAAQELRAGKLLPPLKAIWLAALEPCVPISKTTRPTLKNDYAAVWPLVGLLGTRGAMAA